MPKVSDEYFENKKNEIVDAAFRVCSKKPITSVVMKDIIDETGFLPKKSIKSSAE